MSLVVTKSTTIQAPYEQVYKFISNPANWPRWLLVDIDSLMPAHKGWWKAQTRSGQILIRMHAHPDLGIIDFDFDFADAMWNVPMRLLSRPNRCVLVATVFEPQESTTRMFDIQVALIHQKLEQLKEMFGSG